MSGSQKFIARNRAPRVQIEYDVELYGAQKKVQLPFVMGVLSDLSGKSEQPPVADRKFLEIDADNFDERMRSMAPRASFTVPDTLTGEGNLAVDLTFEKMEDFSPEAIAAKVEALAPLLEARKQLSDLMAYMDGKSRAEALIENLLTAPDLLRALGGGAADATDMDAALASLKARMPEPEPEDDGRDRTLAELAARAPQDTPRGPSAEDVLAGIERPSEAPARDETADVLAGIERRAVAEEEDRTDDVLAGIERASETAADDATTEVLAGITRREDPAPEDRTSDVLARIRREDNAGDRDDAAEILAGIERREPSQPQDRTGEILAGIERREDTGDADLTDEVLASVERREAGEDADRTSDVLAGIERRETIEETDDTADVLAGIERVTERDAADVTGDVLATIERREDTPEDDGVGDVLAGIERRAEVEDRDDAAQVLAGIERSENVAETDDVPDVLARLERRADEDEEDATDDILSALEPPATDPESTEDLDEILAGLESPDAVPVSEDAVAPLAASEGAPAPGTGSAAPVSREPAEPVGPEETGRYDSVETATGGSPMSGRKEPDDLPQDLGATTDADSAPGEPSDLLGEADDALGADLDALLADLDAPAAVPADRDPDDTPSAGEAAADDLDDLLAELEGTETPAASVDETPEAEFGTAAEPVAAEDDLDALLGELGESEGAGPPVVEAPEMAPVPDSGPEAEGDLDALLAELGGADDAAAPGTAEPEEPADPEAQDDLDALLAELDAPGGDTEPAREAPPADAGHDDGAGGDTGLDDLLTELGAAEVGKAQPDDDLDALLSDLTGDTQAPDTGDGDAEDDLDALLADMGATDLGADTLDAPLEAEAAAVPAPRQTPYGTISAPKPERDSMNRSRFRMAIFGDFTGRAARGLMETGDALAGRKAIPLDVDTVEDVIEGFGTTLTLPIGREGEGIEVKLGGLDDLHPDELYGNVEIFEAIAGLRQQLGVGSMAGRTTERLKAWAEEFGTPVRLPKRSAATSVPPDLKLSDFQALIGDTRGTLTRATPADDLIARIVGPHVVKAPDAGAAEMLKAVDEALGAAMRLVLHHPDFQAVESQWRSLDLLARRIETDTNLEIVLYDVSAEEMAADLAAQEDLARSGLYRLLTEVMDPEEGDGGYSALFGLYTFEETPPHAELLARIGQVAAHVDAPFFAAISPAYLETPKEDRHRLVAEAWDSLRAQPQAAWLGLASPRFLLRQPYGAKSDPIYEFEFEEFTPKEGLKGLLWANPVVLVAVLLAATYKKDGRSMNLGSLMSLGELPFTYVKDRYGDQVALPCTERNLTSDPAQATLARGYMPVLWVKGRNEIRLGSFRSLAGTEIAGPWSSAPPPRPAPPGPTLEMEIEADGASGGGGSADAAPAAPAADDPLAELDSLLDTGGGPDADDGLDLLGSGDDDDGQSLDDLLASFSDEGDTAADDDDMDPELAALLEGL